MLPALAAESVGGGKSSPLLEVSPDGNLVATVDKAGRLVLAGKASTRDPKAPEIKLELRVLVLAFSPDSKLLVAGGADGAIAVVDVLTRKSVAAYRVEQMGDIASLAVLPPEGKQLAVAGAQGGLAVVDLLTGKDVRRFSGSAKWTGPLTVSKGKALLACAASDGKLRVWDLRTLNPLGAVDWTPSLVSPLLAMSPDGETLAVSGPSNQLDFWSMASGRKQFTRAAKGGDVTSMAFDPSSRQLTALCADGTVNRFDATSGVAMMVKMEPTEGTLRLLPDAEHVAAVTSADLKLTATPPVPAPSPPPEVNPSEEKYIPVTVYYGTNRKPLNTVSGSWWWHVARSCCTLDGLRFIALAVFALGVAWTLVRGGQWLWRKSVVSGGELLLTLLVSVGLCVLVALGVGYLFGLRRGVEWALFAGLVAWLAIGLSVGGSPGWRRIALAAVWLTATVGVVLSFSAWCAGRNEALTRGTHFSGRDAEEMIVGSCQVTIPLATHTRGNIERPEIMGLQIEVLDPDKHMCVSEVKIAEPAAFVEQLREKMKASAEKEAFVFVHGFNVTFEDAALRTAQMAFDLEFQGAPMFYSWPSQGTVAGYPWDSDAVETAIPYLKEYLKTLASKTDVKRVHLIAHSMGNRLLTRVLRELPEELGANKTRDTFREIVLAAPDINAHVFRTQIAPALVARYPRVTLYANSNDGALAASWMYNHSPRAGDSHKGCICVYKGLDTIDVSALDTTMDGHGYVGSNHVVLCDLYYLFKEGKSPSHRFRLQPRQQDGLPYFVFAR